MEHTTKIYPDPKTFGARVYERIINGVIYLLAFLLPIFFLPWTSEVLEFNKQALVIILTTVAVIFWLLKILVSNKLEWTDNLLNPAVAIFLVVYFLSALFSLFPSGSLIGFANHLSQSFIVILCGILLYFVAANNFRTRQQAYNLGLVFLSSIFLAGVFGLLQILKVFIFPWDFSRFNGFNTVGGVNSLAALLALGLSVLTVLFLLPAFADQRRTIFLKLIFGLVGAFFLAMIILLNYWSIWLTLLLTMLAVLVFGILKTPAKKPTGFEDINQPILPSKLLTIPMAIVLISLYFLVAKPVLPVNLNLPVEISPSYRASLSIAKETLLERPLLGSGPETFQFVYAKHRSEAINQTVFWNTRFTNAISQIISLVATAGILGLATYLLILVGVIWLVGRFLLKKEVGFGGDWVMVLALFAGWLILVVNKFVYTSSLTAEILFWLLTGLLIGLVSAERRIFSLDISPRMNLIISFSFIVLVILGLTGLYLETQRYVAEVYYRQGLVAAAQGKNLDEVSSRLTKAINFNSNQDLYLRQLSQVALLQIQQEMAKTDQPKEAIQQRVSSLSATAVQAAKQAADLSPADVNNWINRASIYQGLIGLLSGADDWAITSYEEAIKLEPKNPLLVTELAKVYLSKVSLLDQNQTIEKEKKEADKKAFLTKAEEYLNKAVELKTDYLPAHYHLALVYDQAGRMKEAIAKMEENKRWLPNDVGIMFQLGLLYMRDGQKGKARAELERARELWPEYSNAHWFLALLYEEGGEKDKALAEFEAVARLNPGNEMVAERIKNLKEGKPSAGLPAEQKPLEQKTEEK